MTSLTYPRPASSAVRSFPPPVHEPAPTHCYSILADADPGVLPRVLELFAKRNLVPERWVADRLPGGAQLSIDLQVRGVAEAEAGHIARCLREIWGVETVLTATKG